MSQGRLSVRLDACMYASIPTCLPARLSVWLPIHHPSTHSITVSTAGQQTGWPVVFLSVCLYVYVWLCVSRLPRERWGR